MGNNFRQTACSACVTKQQVCQCKVFLCPSRQKQEREELIKQLSQLLGMELMEEVIKESVKETSVNELRYVQCAACSSVLSQEFPKCCGLPCLHLSPLNWHLLEVFILAVLVCFIWNQMRLRKRQASPDCPVLRRSVWPLHGALSGGWDFPDCQGNSSGAPVFLQILKTVSYHPWTRLLHLKALAWSS